jgi:DNA ligase-1
MIHQDGTKTRWFTSDNKEFTLPFILPTGNYVLIGEFMYGCSGKLGDRVKSAIITTLRTNFKKGIDSFINFDSINIKIFDILNSDRVLTSTYTDRMRSLDTIHPNITLVSQKLVTGAEALEALPNLIKNGYEGIMLREPESPYEIGKRVHHSIKVKVRKTVDLRCIGVEEGLGKCNGIGALILQDSDGRIVKVGSGLGYDTPSRTMDYVGKIIEIQYEQILDTYIQPTFICVRDDKDESD